MSCTMLCWCFFYVLLTCCIVSLQEFQRFRKNNFIWQTIHNSHLLVFIGNVFKPTLFIVCCSIVKLSNSDFRGSIWLITTLSSLQAFKLLLSCLIHLQSNQFGTIFAITSHTTQHLFQLTMPDDFRSWLLTLDAEFDGRLIKMLRGPMWSGLSPEEIGNPLMVQFIKK